MATIQEELWNVFTFYTLHGNPRDPSRLNRSCLYKLCRDTMVMDPTMTETSLSQADLQLIFTSEIKNAHSKLGCSSKKSDKLEYEEFLSCLIRIAQKCYQNSPTAEDAMQQLLMDNILPLASRRKPIDVSVYTTNPLVDELHEYYGDALSDLFNFYSTFSDHTAKVKNMVKSTSTTASSPSFDLQRALIKEAREKCHEQSLQANRMSYSDFIKFASEFGFASMGLTSLDLGDIYMSVISMKDFQPILRKIDYIDFWESLVRCALIAFKHLKIGVEEKIKGMFLNIWRHLQSTARMNAMSTLNGGGFNTYKGALLRGSQILNERFIAAWTKDGYRDYLDPKIFTQTKESEKVAAMTNFLGGEVASSGGRSRSPASAWGERDTSFSDTSSNDGMSPGRGTGQLSSSAPLKSTGQSVVKKKQQQQPPQVTLDLGLANSRYGGDHYDFGDDRIQVASLHALLTARPDVAQLLQDCIEEENLDELSSDDET